MSDVITREHSLYNEDITYRAIEEDGKRFIEGYAAKFNSRSKLLFEQGRYFYEEIQQGAFADVLSRGDLDVYFAPNHDREKIIARQKNGTLVLKEDETGLWFRAEIPNVSYANDTYELVKVGTLYDNSFAFQLREDGFIFNQLDKRVYLKIITKVSDLIDVSTVTRGAYNDTSVLARDIPIESIDEHLIEVEDEIYKVLHKLRSNQIELY